MTGDHGTLELKPWTLPLIVAAIVVPGVAGFVLGGPPLGLAVGFVAATVVVVLAARQRPRGPIETAAPGGGRHVLLVLSHELDDPDAIDHVTRAHSLDDAERSVEVRVLAPAKSTLLDRWATDVAQAQGEAGRKLVISVASLGKAGVTAEASVGDENIVQAVEDELRTFPATEVILVTGPSDGDREGERAASELAERLRQPFERVVLGAPHSG